MSQNMISIIPWKTLGGSSSCGCIKAGSCWVLERWLGYKVDIPHSKPVVNLGQFWNWYTDLGTWINVSYSKKKKKNYKNEWAFESWMLEISEK